MKFIHLSDLHIGKHVNGKSMLEEQNFIFRQILEIITKHNPDVVLIAGDIYDKTVPSAEAVQLCDWLLSEVTKHLRIGAKLFVSSGNHDSAERIAFGASIMSKSGVYVSPVYDGVVQPIPVSDEFGEVMVYMLPFVKPTIVRHYFDDEKIESYNDAVAVAIKKMNVDTSKRNILVAHQFVTGSERTDSEEVSVGGLDNVDVSVFSDFDYVALGHLHRPQYCGRETVRYAGSPLKYSFSEVADSKCVTIVEIGEKGELKLSFEPLVPLHDWHDLRGTYEELVTKSFYENSPYQSDFVRITLTDENDVPDAIGKLRTIYHNILELRYDNKRTQAISNGVIQHVDVSKTPDVLFSQLYEMQNNQPMSTEQSEFMSGLIEKIWEK